MQCAYCTLPTEDVADYALLHAEILEIDNLFQVANHWLQPDQLTPGEVVKWLVIDCVLRGLPTEEQHLVGMAALQSPCKLIDALEYAVTTLEMT